MRVNTSSSLLATVRKKRKMSLTKLAKRSGISLVALSKIEHGTRRIQIEEVRPLAKALRCSPNALLPDLDDDPSNEEVVYA